MLPRWLYLEYILELDKDGVIIGGEWVGDSKEDILILTYTYGYRESKLFDLMDRRFRETVEAFSLVC